MPIAAYLLRQVFALVQSKGYQLGNCDLTILAEKPKLAGFISTMQQCIAADLQSSLEQVSIKATTTEKLGFVGRQEGIEAHAVVFLVPV
jgi:2-C-methyl-D-erythritol 2,4-cyclodiphosphate synthase